MSELIKTRSLDDDDDSQNVVSSVASIELVILRKMMMILNHIVINDEKRSTLHPSQWPSGAEFADPSPRSLDPHLPVLFQFLRYVTFS